MLEKIKNYYRNSPKRIALLLLGVHVIFLLVGLAPLVYEIYIHQYGFSDFSTVVVYAILFFPSISLLYLVPNNLNSPVFPWIFFIFYYALFGLLVVKARDTSSKQFLIFSVLFAALFVINLAFGLLLVFNPGSIPTP